MQGGPLRVQSAARARVSRCSGVQTAAAWLWFSAVAAVHRPRQSARSSRAQRQRAAALVLDALAHNVVRDGSHRLPREKQRQRQRRARATQRATHTHRHLDVLQHKPLARAHRLALDVGLLCSRERHAAERVSGRAGRVARLVCVLGFRRTAGLLRRSLLDDVRGAAGQEVLAAARRLHVLHAHVDALLQLPVPNLRGHTAGFRRISAVAARRGAACRSRRRRAPSWSAPHPARAW